MSDAYEVTIESNDPTVNARLVVRADGVQQLHDRLVAVVDGACFTMIGAAVASMRDDVEAQQRLGSTLDARPVEPPKSDEPASAPKVTEKPVEAATEPKGSPWDAGQDAPNLPAPKASEPATPPPANQPPQQAGNFPPMPKWAQ